MDLNAGHAVESRHVDLEFACSAPKQRESVTRSKSAEAGVPDRNLRFHHKSVRARCGEERIAGSLDATRNCGGYLLSKRETLLGRLKICLRTLRIDVCDLDPVKQILACNFAERANPLPLTNC